MSKQNRKPGILLMLLLSFSCSAPNKNISVGFNHDTGTTIAQVCKHGADWQHPSCDDTLFYKLK